MTDINKFRVILKGQPAYMKKSKSDNNSEGSDRLDALRQRLYSITSIEGVDRRSGQIARQVAVDNFLEDMFHEIQLTQPIMKKNLTQEDQDFIKYWLAYQIADKIIDDCATVTQTENKVTVKLLAVKALAPKNQ